jgi:hypothetical protein
LAAEYGFNEVSYRLAPTAPRNSRDRRRVAEQPSHRRLTSASAAVITAVDALVDVRSSRVLA